MNVITSLESKFTPLLKKIQPKLQINVPGDRYEQEADAMADWVMRMSSNNVAKPLTGLIGRSLQRKCAHCEEEEKRKKTIMRKAEAGDSGMSVSSSFASSLNASKSGGFPLTQETRNFMESAFSTDFSSVKIHTDSKASEMSKGINANAFTYGNNIYFREGQYNPETKVGKHLLAHELTHVIQQRSGQYTGTQRDATDDARLDDPNFLICLALTYIGLPPSLWRTVVNQMLRAVNEQYREEYGEERGAERFAEFSAAYSTWSFFNKVKAVLTFIGESRIGPITIQLARATAIRTAALRVLERAGIRTATVVAASQIIRKVAVFLELAWAAGCFLYCTAEQYAILVRDLSIMMIEAITNVIHTFSQIAGSMGGAIGQAISQAILITQAKIDISNWIYASELPPRTRLHLAVIISVARLAGNANDYLTYIARPLHSYLAEEPILRELAEDLNTAMQSRGGFSQLVTFTPDFLGRLTPLTLLDLMIDYRFISFRRPPEELAREAASLE